MKGVNYSMATATGTTGDLLSTQRAVLERLGDLTAAQLQALEQGDLATLVALSESRAQLVQDAATALPPHQAWDRTLTDLVAHTVQHSDDLRQVLCASLAGVRREMAELTVQEQMTHYLKTSPVSNGSSWTC